MSRFPLLWRFAARLLLLLAVAYGCCTASLSAQIEESATAEQLENFFRDSDQASETDVQQLLERLEDLRAHPLDLNTCTPEELYDLRLFSPLQLASFFAYRASLGPFLNDVEVQAVPNWELTDVRRLLLYATTAASLEQRNTRLSEGLLEGRNELLLRYGQPVPFNLNQQTLEGGPHAVALRYRHTFDNRLRFGFTLENDPGEALFRGSNRRSFDFYSIHFFGQNINRRLRTLALGDYSARFGQGLLLQTGFAPGKSAETATIARGGRKLNQYSAFGENFFFRGAAATVALAPQWELTALYSHRRKDGNVLLPDTTDQEDPERAFTSLQTSGLHRTPSEVADEKALREQVAAASLTWQRREGHISLNGLYVQYGASWQPDPQPYRLYAFRGNALSALSADYSWRRRNWFLFGETARSHNGAVATLNGLFFSPDRHVTLTVLHRDLSPRYQSVYAMPFAEVSGASNEKGLYLGTDIRFIRRWQINLYADLYRHPWLRFGTGGPSQGRDFLARVQWQRSKVFQIYGQWQSETKEGDSDFAEVTGLLENRRDRFRLHATYKIATGVEMRSRVEWTTFQVARTPRQHGFIAYQEAVWKPLSLPLSGALRYALYDTDNFDTRVFAFETDLFSAVSIPAFSGTGARYYVNLKYRLTRWLRLEGRFEQTVQRRAVTTSGITGRETFYKILARVKW